MTWVVITYAKHDRQIGDGEDDVDREERIAQQGVLSSLPTQEDDHGHVQRHERQIDDRPDGVSREDHLRLLKHF